MRDLIKYFYLYASAKSNTKIFTHWPRLCSDLFVFRYIDKTLLGDHEHKLANINKDRTSVICSSVIYNQ